MPQLKKSGHGIRWCYLYQCDCWEDSSNRSLISGHEAAKMSLVDKTLCCSHCLQDLSQCLHSDLINPPRRTEAEREWVWDSNGGMMAKTRTLVPVLPHIRHHPPLLHFTSLCPLCYELCYTIPGHYHLTRGTWMLLKCHSSHLNSRSLRFQEFSLNPNVFSEWSLLMLSLWPLRMGQSCHDILRCILNFFITINTYLIPQ